MELWLAFMLASILILIVPGPTIILVISQAITHGRRSVMPLAIGVLLGDFTAMTMSFLGLGMVLSASAALFNLFKWAGAVYLVYLGIRLWRTDPGTGTAPSDIGLASARFLLKRSFIVTALNPKSIAFFVAFLPQFIDPAKPPVSQMILLGGTFLSLAVINAALYAAFAGRLGAHIQRGPVRQWLNRCGGTVLIGAGMATAAMQRTS